MPNIKPSENKIKANVNAENKTITNVNTTEEGISANIPQEDISVKAKLKNELNDINSNVASTDNYVKTNVIGDNVIKSNSQAYPSATTTKKGIIRIATDEEAIEGEDNTTAITPHTLRLVTNYVHEQGIASDIWVIEHNLNKKPSVTVVDTAEEEQIPDRKVYNSKNKITLYFLSEFAGKAFLN